jgi:uncharacterized SAM-binding protein YcdF (DUF218 family)
MIEETELLLRILCDTVPARVEAAYLFAQTQPNQESVFATARRLLHARRAGKVLISDCDPKSGYVGAAAYRAAMVAYGVADERIEDVPMEPTDILHTLIEARAVVRYATTNRYQRLIVVSAPFHQQRAFITMASVALREYPALKFYSVPGNAQPWDEVVTHSQGTLTGTRAGLIAREAQRIEAYTAQGDLLPRERILQYLRTRD